MKNKRLNIIIYISVVLFSVLFVIVGNKIATKNLKLSDNSDITSYKATVKEIVSSEITETELSGTDPIEGFKIIFSATVKNGDLKGKDIIAEQESTIFSPSQLKKVEVGDKVIIIKNAALDDRFILNEYVRFDGIVFLILVFFAGILVFGKLKGLNTIVSLCFTCLSVFAVFIPAVLSGKNIYLWSIIICAFSIVMTLVLMNGINKKSYVSILGCVGGLLCSGMVALIMDKTMKLTGLLNDESLYLLQLNIENPIDLRGIIFSAILIGAMGAVMDVSMSVSSSLYEISCQVENVTFSSLFKSGINIGQDMMGTMANTLVLAYIGSSLSTVLLLVSYTESYLELLNKEMIIVEFLQALSGSIGMLLAIPLTSAIAGILYTKSKNKML
ncbi:MAG: YibE/F family protein [Clostridia bacterium]|nr:YibE/F family protein [Clostridia bacterium]